jgi:hypothetical protein
MQIPGLLLEDLYLDAKVTILSRVLKVTAYADARTSNFFSQFQSRTFAMIKPHAY